MQLIGSASCCACADHFKLSVFVTGLAVIVWKHVDPDVLSCPSEPALRLRDKHQIVCIRDLPVSAPTCLRWVMPGQAAELLRPQLDRSESTRDRMLHGLRPFSNPYTYTSSDSHYWSSWTCRPMRVVCPGGRLKWQPHQLSVTGTGTPCKPALFGLFARQASGQLARAGTSADETHRFPRKRRASISQQACHSFVHTWTKHNGQDDVYTFEEPSKTTSSHEQNCQHTWLPYINALRRPPQPGRARPQR